jgi:SAM-dependent methyltransferase
VVKEKYGEIAMSNNSCSTSSCGCSCGSSDNDEYINMMTDDYNELEGYVPDADLGLGCGTPTAYIKIEEGFEVLDLGSGAGNDVFIIAKQVGEDGWVTGLDMTKEMVMRANFNMSKLGIENVDFVLGEIEEMPFSEFEFDVVVSNCVLNLVPDKTKAFSEIHRVLKKGGQFCISDIVLEKELPENLKDVATIYTGCISGASLMDDYLNIIKSSGFTDIQIHKKAKIDIPQSFLNEQLPGNSIDSSSLGIYSITVSATK